MIRMGTPKRNKEDPEFMFGDYQKINQSPSEFSRMSQT